MAHPAERKHLRAVFGRGDMADLLAAHANRRRLRAEMAIRVDLCLDAAIAEDALGHDRDRVDALIFAGDDEGRGLVVRIGRAGADAGDEGLLAGNSAPSQSAAASRKGLTLPPSAATRRVSTIGSVRTRRAVLVGVARTGARPPRPDAADNRAGMAAHDALVALLAGAELLGLVAERGARSWLSSPARRRRLGAPRGCDAAGRGFGGSRRRSRGGWRRGLPEPRGRAPARRHLSRRKGRAAREPRSG